MGKYFCVYCDVDPNGHHIKGCPRYKTPEENTEKIMDEFDELFQKLAKATGIKLPGKDERNPRA